MPSNVHRVTVTSRYVIEGGERTTQFYAINQEIYDSLGRLHTEIDFDLETRYPDNYRWYYYDGMTLVRKEYYVNEKLDQWVVFEYNADSLVSKKLFYGPLNDGMALFKTIDYTYNEKGLPEQIEALNNRGRRLYRIRSAFDDRGTELRRRVRTRRGGEPDDSIRRLDREAEYDSLGNLVTERVRLRMTDRSRNEFTRNYQFDENGNLTEMLELDPQDNQVVRVEYDWQQNRNRLLQIRCYDENNRLENWLAKRYEIYNTTDRRQRVIDY